MVRGKGYNLDLKKLIQSEVIYPILDKESEIYFKKLINDLSLGKIKKWIPESNGNYYSG